MAKPSSYRVEWTAVAEQDLTAILDYVSAESIPAAIHLMNLIYEKAESLAHFPERMRVVPELQIHGVERYRELIVDPYRLFCLIQNATVYVQGVFDSRRDVEELLLQRLMMDD